MVMVVAEWDDVKCSTRFQPAIYEHSLQLYRREFLCYLVHKVPGGNSGPDTRECEHHYEVPGTVQL
jgi:hypothetical protein